MPPRIAFVDYFPTHYRLRLYEELGRRPDVDFYFFADQPERYVLETDGVEPDKVFVAGQAVDSARFTAVDPQRNGDVPEILYVGQFEERKGLPYLIDAFESLQAPARLRLVGNGTQEPWLRER